VPALMLLVRRAAAALCKLRDGGGSRLSASNGGAVCSLSGMHAACGGASIKSKYLQRQRSQCWHAAVVPPVAAK
jgi:hypothetical protein